MIQHASLMDVFNAAGQAASPFLGKYTEKLKKRNDLQIENNWDDCKEETADWLRDNPYDGNVETPEAYRDRLNKFTDKLFLKGSDKKGSQNKNGYLYKGLVNGNSSAYYQEQMKQMQDKLKIQNQGTALKKHDEWRMSDERRQCADDMQAGMEMSDPEEGWRHIERSVEILSLGQYVSPEQKAETLRKAGTALYQRHYARAAEAAVTLEDLQKAVTELKYGRPVLGEDGNPVMGEDGNPVLKGGFTQFMPDTDVAKFYEEDVPVLDENGNPVLKDGKPVLKEKKGSRVLDENGKPVLDKKKWSPPEEWETKVLQERAGEIIQGEEGFFRRLVVSGHFGEAMAYAEDKGARLNRCYKKDDPGGFYKLINDQQRKQFDGYFDLGTLKGFLSGGGGRGGRGELQALLYFKAETFLSAFLEHDGRVRMINPETGEDLFPDVKVEDLLDARDTFIETNHDLYWSRHDPDNEAHQLKYQKMLVDWTDDYWTSLGKVMDRVGDSALKETWKKFTNWKTYMTGEFKNRHIKDNRELEDFAQSCLSKFQDFIMTTPNPTSLEAERFMKEFTGKNVNKILERGRTPNQEGDRWKHQAELNKRIESYAAEGLIWTDIKGEVKFATPKVKAQIEEHMEREREDVALALGIDIKNVEWGWTISDTRRNDIKPKAFFKVTASKEGGAVTYPGQYRVEYDERSNKRIMMLKTTPKYDAAGNLIAREEDWALDRTRTRQETNAERVRRGAQNLGGNYYGGGGR